MTVTKLIVKLLITGIFAVVCLNCGVEKMGSKSIAAPTEAQKFVEWADNSKADDLYVKYDRIFRDSSRKAANAEGEIYFVPATKNPAEIFDFYAAQLKTVGFEVTEMPLQSEDGRMSRCWSKSGLLSQENFAVLWLKVSDSGEDNLLLTYHY